MADKTVQKTILGIMMDPHSLCMLQDRRDEYGDIMLPKTLKTIEGVREIANSFGFEEGTAAAIAVMEELTVPCYGAVGEEFLRQIDPAYTKALYGRRLARRLFRELPEETMETICRGLESLIACTHHTPEEKIALMIKTGRIFADSLERRGVAIIFTNQYKYFIIDKSAEAGVLTDYIIPKNDLPKRDKLEHTQEELSRRRNILQRVYGYCLANPEKVPERFREGWSGITEEILVSYYVAQLGESEIEELYSTL